MLDYSSISDCAQRILESLCTSSRWQIGIAAHNKTEDFEDFEDLHTNGARAVHSFKVMTGLQALLNATKPRPPRPS